MNGWTWENHDPKITPLLNHNVFSCFIMKLKDIWQNYNLFTCVKCWKNKRRAAWIKKSILGWKLLIIMKRLVYSFNHWAAIWLLIFFVWINLLLTMRFKLKQHTFFTKIIQRGNYMYCSCHIITSYYGRKCFQQTWAQVVSDIK